VDTGRVSLAGELVVCAEDEVINSVARFVVDHLARPFGQEGIGHEDTAQIPIVGDEVLDDAGAVRCLGLGKLVQGALFFARSCGAENWARRQSNAPPQLSTFVIARMPIAMVVGLWSQPSSGRGVG
jgi:hypothetical protein